MIVHQADPLTNIVNQDAHITILHALLTQIIIAKISVLTKAIPMLIVAKHALIN